MSLKVYLKYILKYFTKTPWLRNTGSWWCSQKEQICSRNLPHLHFEQSAAVGLEVAVVDLAHGVHILVPDFFRYHPFIGQQELVEEPTGEQRKGENIRYCTSNTSKLIGCDVTRAEARNHDTLVILVNSIDVCKNLGIVKRKFHENRHTCMCVCTCA